MKLTARLFACTFLASTTSLILPATTSAQEGAVTTTFQQHAYGGGLDKGIEAIDALGDGDLERFASGALMFMRAIEGLQQDLFRYGAGNRAAAGPGGGLTRILPIFRVPVASNPDAEVPTYEDTRAILERFSERMARAEGELAKVGESDFKLPVDLVSLSLDANGNGLIEQEEKLMGIVAGLNPRSVAGGDADTALKVKFDAADAKWLQGYSSLLKGFADAFLAFDYEPTFDSTFHVIFGEGSTRFARRLDDLKVDPEMLALLKKQLAEVKRENEEKFPEAERKKHQDEFNRISKEIRAINSKTLSKDEKKQRTDKLRAEQREITRWQRRERRETRAEKTIQQRIDRLENPDLQAIRAEHRAASEEMLKITKLKPQKTAEKREYESQLSAIMADSSLAESEKSKKVEALKLEISKVDDWFQEAEKARHKLAKAQTKFHNVSGRSTGGNYGGVLDAIAFIHTVSWKIEDRERLESARLGLIKTMRLNQDIWRLARAETDNDGEWLPNAKQDGPFARMQVTDEVIDGWLKTVGSVEKVLEGELLLPSLRFPQGINLKRYLAETERFDPVMFTTGQDSVAYAQAGKIWDGRLWRALTSPFGNRFMSFALWFN